MMASSCGGCGSTGYVGTTAQAYGPASSDYGNVMYHDGGYRDGGLYQDNRNWGGNNWNGNWDGGRRGGFGGRRR